MITADELAALSLFAALPAERRRYFASCAADVRLAAGEYAIHEGEVPVFLVVIEGTLDVTKRIAGVERVLATRTAGDYFGEVPLMIGAPAFANARAGDAGARLMRVDAIGFRELVDESPAMAAAVTQSLAERVGDLRRVSSEAPAIALTLVGRRWDAACHDLRDFLARNQVPFGWLEPDDPAVAARVPQALPHVDACPVVVVQDGPVLVQPTLRELACALELGVDPAHEAYDVVVIGGGPAGLAAALYGASEGLTTLMVEREAPGGQAGTSSRIENYLGFPAGLSGGDLGHRALEQARRLGAEIVVTRSVTEIAPGEAEHALTLDGGDVVRARAIVLASGVTWRTLPVDGIERFSGRGVYYGAARAEAQTTAGKDAYLIGGGNSAGQAAAFFANYARSVTIVIRGRALDTTMSAYLIEQLDRKGNVRVVARSEVVAVEGDDHLSAIVVRDRDGRDTRYETSTLFVFIGAEPQTGWLPDAVLRDADGYVLTGPDVLADPRAQWTAKREPYLLESSVPRIFAAGDVRHASIKRVAASVGEGSIAIAFVHQALAAELEPAR